MRWVKKGADMIVPLTVNLALARAAADRDPNDPYVIQRLGEALKKNNEYGEAAELFESVLRRSPETFSSWALLAHCYSFLGRMDEALAMCRRGEEKGPTVDLYCERARALSRQNRPDEVQAVLLAALELDNERPGLLALVLSPLAKSADGGRLLAVCDALPEPYRLGSLARAHRAIAFSRLGRTDEARRMMDVARYVSIVPFEPPSEFGSLEKFNATLSNDILTELPAPSRIRDGVNIDYDQDLHRSETFHVLRQFVAKEIVAYLDRSAATGFAEIMPRRPEEGSFWGASTVLSGTGRNGQHVHPRGYLSTVYYASIPSDLGDPSDTRGSLVLGPCDHYTRGYEACWDTRYIKPRAGWLVIFPSHIYHDVVPTQSKAVRISVPADLVPSYGHAD